MKNKKKLILVIFIVLLIGLAFYSIKGVLTPYVSFKTAMETGNYVQVIGKLSMAISPGYKDGIFVFSLVDKNNEEMKFFYKGAKPLNFEHADQIVVLGKYASEEKVFKAEKLLVKCPSKYIKEIEK